MGDEQDSVPPRERATTGEHGGSASLRADPASLRVCTGFTQAELTFRPNLSEGESEMPAEHLPL